MAPRIDQVGVAVVRAQTDPSRGDEIVEPVLLALVTRQDFDGIRWENVNATAALFGQPRAGSGSGVKQRARHSTASTSTRIQTSAHSSPRSPRGLRRGFPMKALPASSCRCASLPADLSPSPEAEVQGI